MRVPSHSYGHNLFGTAGIGAATAVARALDRGIGRQTPVRRLSGGEDPSGRDGPATARSTNSLPRDTRAITRSSRMDSLSFNFEGESAYAAASPESANRLAAVRSRRSQRR